MSEWPRTLDALKDVHIKQVECPADKPAISLACGEGLELQVTRRAKVFYYRFRSPVGRRGRKPTRRVRIGPFPALQVKDAIRRLRELQIMLADGRDPWLERRLVGQTMGDAAAQFLERHRSIRAKTREDYRRLLHTLVLPTLGNIPLGKVQRSDVVRLLDRIYQTRTPQVADHARIAISSLFSFAAQRGELDGANPCLGLKRLTVKSDRRPPRPLADHELNAFWRALDGLIEPDASALRFQLVTGCRITEALHLHWDEVDGDRWTLSAARSKNGHERVTPLSSLAMGVLTVQPSFGLGGFVFQARGVDGELLERPRNQTSISPGLRSLRQFKPQVRTHDLRHTVATGLAALGYSSELVGAVLGHAPVGLAARVYIHFDGVEDKRRALDSWAAHLVEQCGLGAESLATLPADARLRSPRKLALRK